MAVRSIIEILKLILISFFQYLEPRSIGTTKWDKVFKNGPSRVCGKQPLKICTLPSTNFTWSILEYFVPNMNEIEIRFLRQVIVRLIFLLLFHALILERLVILESRSRLNYDTTLYIYLYRTAVYEKFIEYCKT